MRVPTFESNRGIGTGIVALLGVFRPSGDPARRAPRRGRALRRGIPVAALAAVLAVVLVPTAALALMTRSASFGSAGAAGGQFGSGGPQGVAVNESTGDVYVTDPGNARVEEFSSSGTFIAAWGKDVDETTGGNICTAASGDTCQAGTSGSANGQFTDPTSIAVDNSGGPSEGDVYVGDNGTNVVQKFSATGTYLATINGSTSTEGAFSSLVGVAVDQSGDLWTADGSTDNIDEFDDTGAFIRQWNDTYGSTVAIAVDSATNAVYLIRGDGNAERWTLTGGNETVLDSGSATALAVDPVTGDMYASDDTSGNRVFVYDSSNTQIDNFATSAVSSPSGLTYYAPTSTTPAEGGSLYVSDSGNNNVDIYGPPSPAAPEIDSESSSSIGASHATVSAQIIPFGLDTTCVFEYVTDATYTSTGFTGAPSVPCTPSDLGSSYTDQTATAEITGLQPSTEYHYEVVATNVDGTTNGLTAVGDQTFTTTPPPSIDAESVANVTSTDATLEAEINPNGGDTTYQFQFGTDTTYSGGTVPANPVDLGSGTSDVAASVPLTVLQPGTTYHFRVVANGNVFGNDQTFTTYAANLPTGLPDSRGYEMVTPADKDNGEPYDRGGTLFGFQGSDTGSAFAYFSFSAFQGSAFDGSYYLSTRGASSWTSQNTIPPQSVEAGLLCASLGPVMEAYSPDLSKGILADGGSLIGSCGTDDPPLVPGTCNSVSPMVTPCTGEAPGVQNLFVRDNSTGSYQLVSSLADAPANTAPAKATFDGASADLSHVVFDEGATLTPDAPSGDDLYEWAGGTVSLVTYVPMASATSCTGAACTPAVGSLAGGSAGYAFNAVSDDGSVVFFTANGNLYVRDNGTSTAQVDASQAGGTGGGGTFLAATPDGSNVFFTDPDTAGLTSNTVSGSGANLYDYNVASGTLTDLTPVSQADVDGVTGISSDGSYLYFVANGSLASGATAGQPNLYVLHGGTITFVATLSGGDGCDWNPSCLSARVSSNGAYVAFTSTNQLTGYNNNGVAEIYLSNAGASSPVCASCNPSGVPPSAGASIRSPYEPGILGGGVLYFQRNVSNSGQVFFDTTDSLLPRASNGMSDVYEYENGQLNLLSSGTNADNDYFVDASATGNDVFFLTSQQLVPQDTDGAVDVYDARVGGGFPPSAPAPACVGDGCKPPPTAPPAQPIAGSVAFVGPGDATPGAPKAILVVTSHRALTGFRFSVVVLVPQKGVITISGAGLTTVKRSVRGAGVYALTVSLNVAHRNALNARHKRKLTITVHVRYKPASGGSSATTFTVTVKA